MILAIILNYGNLMILLIFVNHDIIKVADGMSLNKLSINYNKTEFLLICNKNKILH